MTKRFFVVRPGVGGEPRYSIEHGDFADRYSKADKATQIDRIELQDGPITLDEAIQLYKTGVRPKKVAKV